jgi:transcriptional regulator with XRE-family HTH domain
MHVNGVALRVIRERSGLSQAELARRGNFSQGYISELEKGTKNPSPAMVQRLAEVLAIPLAALVGDAPDEAGAA